jgi:signal transduction histidine kinase
MSLRSRLIILFGSLLAVVLAGAWWWSTWLTRQMSAELDQAAEIVGRSVVSLVGNEPVWFDHSEPVAGEPKVDVLVERIVEGDDRRVRAVHREHDGQVVGLSIQVDDQPAQMIKLPEPVFVRQQAVMDFEIHAVRENLDESARLQVVRAGVSRDIPIPDQGVQDVLDRFSSQLFVGLTLLLGLGLVLAAWIAHRVSDPLRQLQRAAERMGGGELGIQVDGQGVSEVQATMTAFNTMSQQLEQLQGARQALRDNQHLSEIGEIGRGLAHSLRNPLNAIGLTIDELSLRAGDDPANRALAQDARRQIKRIDESIRGFLTLADAGNTATEAIDLKAVCQDVALEVVQQVDSGVEVETELPDEPIVIEGLMTEVRAMVQSLVVNAAEASPSGETVRLILTPHSGAARIQVSDRGGGLDPEIQQRLFEPHATTKPDGSGMGLYLTQRLAANRYLGALSLESRDGGGVLATLDIRSRKVEQAE